MDGLASGLAGITAGFFILVAHESNQLPLSSFSSILVGVCVGIYYFTALPARYFLGDSGAQFLGFILSGLAIAYNPPGFLPTQSWFIPILLLGVPLFDSILVIYSRLRNGKPIYQSGLDHTYHRLVRMGMHPNRSVLTMHLSAVLLGCLAFMVLYLPPVWSNGIFGLIVLAGGLILVYLEKWNPLS
jgi:UDP-GlcNAc:undecaprenyl-phosphate GlcNAc-1-phosphate transferase